MAHSQEGPGSALPALAAFGERLTIANAAKTLNRDKMNLL